MCYRRGVVRNNKLSNLFQHNQPQQAKTTTLGKPEVATVIAAYQATGQEQLSLQVGQIVSIRKKNESGWWEGELQVRLQSFNA